MGAFSTRLRVGIRRQLDEHRGERGDGTTFEIVDARPELVGITEAPSDFDETSPQMVFSRSYLAAHPDVGVVQTIIAVYLHGVRQQR